MTNVSNVKVEDLNPGDEILVKDLMYIDKTIMSWKVGDTLTIREVEPLYDRILVNDTDGDLAEYIYNYEFRGLEFKGRE